MPRKLRIDRPPRSPSRSCRARRAPGRRQSGAGSRRCPARCAGRTTACPRTRRAASAAPARCTTGPAGRWRWGAPTWHPGRRQASTTGWVCPMARRPDPASGRTGCPRSSPGGSASATVGTP
eukprot:scaffold11238_cov114-Isochrysis_galbana.AAC.5